MLRKNTHRRVYICSTKYGGAAPIISWPIAVTCHIISTLLNYTWSTENNIQSNVTQTFSSRINLQQTFY